jgi:ribosomal protein L20
LVRLLRQVILAQLAVSDPDGFGSVIQQAKAALG